MCDDEDAKFMEPARVEALAARIVAVGKYGVPHSTQVINLHLMIDLRDLDARVSNEL